MPLKPFQPVSLDPCPKAPRGRPPKSIKRQPIRYNRSTPKVQAQVSQFTRDRLYIDALIHPAYEGIEPDEIRTYINQKLDEYIAHHPVWFGHLAIDRPKKPLSDAQKQHLDRMRQRKVELQAEADAPYVPEVAE